MQNLMHRMYFSASISTDGKRSVNYSVQNQEIFDANEKTFEADRKEFEEAVKKMN